MWIFADMREVIGRVKVRKCVGLHKDSLIRKVKAVHASKAKQEILPLLPNSRQMFSHAQKEKFQLA